MEGETSPETPGKGRRRRLLAIIIGVALVAAGVAIWWQFLRPRTIVEVLAFDHFQPGSQVVVSGTITGIFWDNQSYGPRVILGLDNERTCKRYGNVVGDPNASYRLGQGFQTTLHFERYAINGDPAVWAPELACPFPSSFEAIGAVADAISDLQSIALAFNGTDAAGWSHFEIATHNGELYREDVLPATLLKFAPLVGTGPQLPAGSSVDSTARWELIEALDYLLFSGGIRLSVVDRLPSLAAGPSANGSLRFVDVDGNRLVDNGDRLDVRLAPTTAANVWDVYQLGIGEWGGQGLRYVNAVHILLNGPYGPWDVPIRERTVPRLDLAYSEDRSGGTITSRLNVARVRFGEAPEVSNVHYSLSASIQSGYNATLLNAIGNVSKLPATLPGGTTVAFADANVDGRLDGGDTLTLTNVPNQTKWNLYLRAGNESIASASWRVGYGPLVGNHPDVSFRVSGSNPWRATANVSFWSPALTLNGTARVSLQRLDGSVLLTNVTLRNGILGTFTNGSLSFSDLDGDLSLSTGDVFVLQGSTTDRFLLSVSFQLESPRWIRVP